MQTRGSGSEKSEFTEIMSVIVIQSFLTVNIDYPSVALAEIG